MQYAGRNTNFKSFNSSNTSVLFSPCILCQGGFDAVFFWEIHCGTGMTSFFTVLLAHIKVFYEENFDKNYSNINSILLQRCFHASGIAFKLQVRTIRIKFTFS